jgi:hypothetical protein
MRDTITLSKDAVNVQKEPPAPHRFAPKTVLLPLYRHLSEVFAAMPRPNVVWNGVTFTALFVLIAIWATLMRATWARWGDLTVDSGHEMYVPALLAAGKMLYRDVWFMFGPAAPYFNSYLFRLFGVHLNVLYWAGSLAALASAIFLYLTGMSLGSWIIGWTTGTILLIEAFEPGLFCFPLPYSFAAVYGCLCACVFLWLMVKAILSGRWAWLLGAGTVAAVALLLKFEFGLACYGTILLLTIAQGLRQRLWKPIWAGVAAILPGILGCAVVGLWMVSIAGADFITHENFQSWPTTYFMKTYGKLWLAQTGFNLSPQAQLAAFGRVFLFAGVMIGPHLLLRRKPNERGLLFLILGLAAAILSFLSPPSLVRGALSLSEHPLLAATGRISIFAGIAVGFNLLRRRKLVDDRLLLILGVGVALLACLSPMLLLQGSLVLGRIFFPADMVLIAGLAAMGAGWFGYAKGLSEGDLAIAFLFTFSIVLPFRILSGMRPAGYPIYYNTPVILSFLFLASCLIVPGPRRSSTSAFRADMIVCCCCLIWMLSHAEVFFSQPSRLQPLTTERGVVWIPKQMVGSYLQAITFLREKAGAGESVLSVPEDTSLYFLSGTTCPTRVYLFTPGVLVPGKMTEETISEIERKKVRYLLWSNRTFPEYGVPVFGKDYDTVFAGYLKSHYRSVGPVIGNETDWNAMVWERMTDAEVSR